MDQQEKLLPEFPPVSVAEWEAKIKEDLKGADYDKKLIHKTLDEIVIKPYYTSQDLLQLDYLDQTAGKFPFVRGEKCNGNNWEIRQDFKVDQTDAAAAKAREAATHGVTSVGFDLTSKGDLYYHDFRKLISEMLDTKCRINIIAGDSAPQILDFLIKALDELKADKKHFQGSLEYDLLGHLAETGGFYYGEQDDMKDAGKILSSVVGEIPGLRVLAVNSHIFADAGATIVQELAFGLAMISEYMVKLQEKGFKPADIAAHLQWNLGAGSDYFMEIAKIRAARMLFSGVMSAFDGNQGNQVPVYINSITTTWNKTLYDPNVNLLRLTTEAMAAILGGCNSLHVRPFDAVYQQPTDFSERMARNIQNILKEESYFDKVADPSAGSYYIENLTHALIESAWKLFLKVDEQGGFIQSFTKGFIREEISKSADKQATMVATKREVVLGTNQYPNVNETLYGCVDETIAFPEPNTDPELIASPLMPLRASTGFEKLRLATEKHKGERPRVFLLTFGNLAMRLARAQFSANFFACAGYEILDNPGFKSAKEGVDAAMQMKADVIVVCSSDDEYAEIAPAVVDLVKDKAIVVVAGAPANMEELKQKGIHEFIHMRSNVLEMLKHFHEKLGIELK